MSFKLSMPRKIILDSVIIVSILHMIAIAITALKIIMQPIQYIPSCIKLKFLRGNGVKQFSTRIFQYKVVSSFYSRIENGVFYENFSMQSHIIFIPGLCTQESCKNSWRLLADIAQDFGHIIYSRKVRPQLTWYLVHLIH